MKEKINQQSLTKEEQKKLLDEKIANNPEILSTQKKILKFYDIVTNDDEQNLPLYNPRIKHIIWPKDIPDDNILRLVKLNSDYEFRNVIGETVFSHDIGIHIDGYKDISFNLLSDIESNIDYGESKEEYVKSGLTFYGIYVNIFDEKLSRFSITKSDMIAIGNTLLFVDNNTSCVYVFNTKTGQFNIFTNNEEGSKKTNAYIMPVVTYTKVETDLENYLNNVLKDYDFVKNCLCSKSLKTVEEDSTGKYKKFLLDTIEEHIVNNPKAMKKEFHAFICTASDESKFILYLDKVEKEDGTEELVIDEFRFKDQIFSNFAPFKIDEKIIFDKETNIPEIRDSDIDNLSYIMDRKYLLSFIEQNKNTIKSYKQQIESLNTVLVDLKPDYDNAIKEISLHLDYNTVNENFATVASYTDVLNRIEDQTDILNKTIELLASLQATSRQGLLKNIENGDFNDLKLINAIFIFINTMKKEGELKEGELSYSVYNLWLKYVSNLMSNKYKSNLSVSLKSTLLESPIIKTNKNFKIAEGTLFQKYRDLVTSILNISDLTNEDEHNSVMFNRTKSNLNYITAMSMTHVSSIMMMCEKVYNNVNFTENDEVHNYFVKDREKRLSLGWPMNDIDETDFVLNNIIHNTSIIHSILSDDDKYNKILGMISVLYLELSNYIKLLENTKIKNKVDKLKTYSEAILLIDMLNYINTILSGEVETDEIVEIDDKEENVKKKLTKEEIKNLILKFLTEKVSLLVYMFSINRLLLDSANTTNNNFKPKEIDGLIRLFLSSLYTNISILDNFDSNNIPNDISVEEKIEKLNVVKYAIKTNKNNKFIGSDSIATMMSGLNGLEIDKTTIDETEQKYSDIPRIRNARLELLKHDLIITDIVYATILDFFNTIC